LLRRRAIVTGRREEAGWLKDAGRFRRHMAFIEPVAALVTSVALVWVLTRLPMVVFPRLRIGRQRLAPHPGQVAVDEHLIISLHRMRRSYWLAVPFAFVPLGYGLLMLRFLPTALGFGLTVGSGWVIVSRLLPASLAPRRRSPYSMALIQDINRVRLHPARCCDEPQPVWQPDAVRCAACQAVHIAEARPDLGRKRSDGWLLGGLRLLLLDGRPATDSTTTEELEAPPHSTAELPIL